MPAEFDNFFYNRNATVTVITVIFCTVWTSKPTHSHS